MLLQNFIVFEGIDGAGTTTQLDILRKRTSFASLDRKDVYFTAEPTSSPTGKFLRQILKGDIKVTDETSAYLFSADRSEHINGKLTVTEDNTLITGVSEACSCNKFVISDRYFFSSLAYQSIKSGLDLPLMLNSVFPLPALLFYFEIDPEISLKRITSRDYTEIYEKEDFLKEVVKQYHKVLSLYKQKEYSQGMKIVTIDATQSKEDISKIIWEEVKKLPIIQ